MIQKNQDEDSLRVRINLISTDLKSEAIDQTNINFPKKSFKQFLIAYVKDLQTYVFERCYMLKTISTKAIAFFIQSYQEFRSRFITRLFWGRGSLYRFFILLLILFPVGTSVAIVYAHNSAAPKVANIAITSALINKSAQVNTDVSIQGKLIGTQTETAPTVTNGQAVNSWYTVNQNDTLDSIATKFNINKDILAITNNLQSDKLEIGQKLIIQPVVGLVYTAKANDTIDAVAKRYSVDAKQIEAWNLFIDATKPLNQGDKILLPGITQDPTIFNYANYTGHAVASTACPADDAWCYFQTDPSWANMILGGGGRLSAYSSINVRNSGCLITDVAMLAQYYFPGKHITPATIAYNPGYFVGGGLFNLSGLGLMNAQPLGGWGYVNWSQIDEQLALGHPVIVGYAYKNHYVVVYKKVGNQYIMNDPANGAGIVMNSMYNLRYATQAFLYTPIGQ